MLVSSFIFTQKNVFKYYFEELVDFVGDSSNQLH